MMSIAHCQESTAVSLVKVEEGNRKAVFRNSARENIVKTQFDGCVEVEGPRADWVISKAGLGDVVVELKGKDVDHAVKQVDATAKFWRKSNLSNGKIAGLIVCRQYPRASTGVQRAQDNFRSVHNGFLHVVTKNETFELEKIFSPSPLKE
jgi:hypothetical protein